jgi:NAD(P)-dependent dehydrogenase (short-subunit alcohol dehydrogenase family)
MSSSCQRDPREAIDLREEAGSVTAFAMIDAQRTAIVTGASRRVGREIACALLADGWTVLAHVRDGGDPVPEGAVAVAADLESADCGERIFAVAAQLPPVKLLVNNAARFTNDSADALDPRAFESHMAVNVRAPLLLSQCFARQHSGEDALIVNILDSKLFALNADFLSYTLSKQALATATELLARAFADKGIRVNGIAPALMLQSPGQSEENFRAMHAANPLGRGVDPDDVVGAVRYLIGATKVTGQSLVIDSGHRFLQLDRDVQFLRNE